MVKFNCIGLKFLFIIDLTPQNMQKLFRSLFLIVFIEVGGYFLSYTASIMIIYLTNSTPLKLFYISFLSNLYFNIANASIAPIVYVNSSDYNEALRKELKYLKTFFKCKKENEDKNKFRILYSKKINILENTQNQLKI
uniref:Uncharacterized protein n=1 Tax=Meloidogyne enterolobii TaxID=390850 RepID=A0A6V7WU63_MELEN|nr:unnamed protein product [Meloidogyne enterolobii]